MKLNKTIVTVLVSCALFCGGCSANRSIKDDLFQEKAGAKRVGNAPSYAMPLFRSKKIKIAIELYRSIYGLNVEKVQSLLAAGANPNVCIGECGWVDSNPINVAVDSFYNTYYRRKRYESLPNPLPDVAILRLLKSKGGNINARPYIWDRVHLYSNLDLEQLANQQVDGTVQTNKAILSEEYGIFVDDSNRVIEELIQLGADVDMKGHAYPFSIDAIRAKMDNEIAMSFFKDGTRPLNEAIAKGMQWEKQVDLLLKYSKLDNDSLSAARLSGDTVMIEKINKLWGAQNKRENP